MRILLAHNYYVERGGEDAVVENEEQLLREHGHQVRLLAVSNDSIKGAWETLRAGWNAPYSPLGKARIARYIQEFRPNIVHVHNFFPLLTPALYDACQNAGVPVVQTLHNYRTICAGSLLMRDGRPCEDCIQGSPYQAVLHRCARNSFVRSLAVARMVDLHRKRGTWHEKVDCFIGLTEFAKSRFVAAGFPAEKIAIKPNFVPDHGPPDTSLDDARTGALFVGRLSPEKGIGTLLKGWESLDVPLSIAGDGPLRDAVQCAARNGIRWLGKLRPNEVAQAMRSAAFLVVPSDCYETFSMALAEAFAYGLPVIASRRGAMAEIVEEGVSGLHFAPGNPSDLAAKVYWVSRHTKELRHMGRRARLVYEKKYAPEANYQQLMEIYEKAKSASRLSNRLAVADPALD